MTWLIVDGHEDIAMAILSEEERDWGKPAPPGRALSLPDARRGGLGLVLATIFAPEGYWQGERPAESGRRQIEFYDELLERHEEHVFRVESRGDLDLCQPGGPIGVIHLMEGADPITRPSALTWWVDRGVRVVGIAWNTANMYCGGATEARGLTDAGRRLLAAMHEEGVICDVSHLSRTALEDVLETAEGRVVASHSNAHARYPHRRNLRDEHIRAIAARDGVVGVVLYGPFLRDGRASIGDVADHIDHMVQLVGPAHVALGTDLDGGFTTDDAPTGIETVADLPRIGEALVRRGYADRDVAAILGGNWLRVLREALPA